MIFGDSRLPQRFWDKATPEANTGCWLWTAGVNSRGRPQFWFDEKMVYAYKITTELERGSCPDGKECSHLCDQKICVNPDHVIYETTQENLTRRRGKPRSDRTYPQHAHLPPAEYAKAIHRECMRALRLRQKEAKCD